MANFSYKGTNADFWNLFPEFGQSTLTVNSDTKIVLKFDDASHDINDNDGHGYRAVFTGTGFKEKNGHITDGQITGVQVFDKNSKLLVEVSAFAFDATTLSGFFQRDNQSLDRFIAAGDDVFTGSKKNDDMQTGNGDDVVNSGGGNDYIKDLGGTDDYNGGSGFDYLSYDEWFWQGVGINLAGIHANLGAGTVVGPDGNTDTIKNIEGVRGTFLNDKLIGDGKDNEFSGLAGKDVIDGKGGEDRVRYDNDENQGGNLGVIVKLNKGVAFDGFGNRDKLKNIEHVEGSDLGDSITGNGGHNWLYGRDGKDTIKGGGGDDSLIGGDDKDTLIGGAGEDVFEFWRTSHSEVGASDVIKGFDANEDGFAFYDELRGIGSFIGTSNFDGNAGETRYFQNGGNTLVQMDVDGNGNADMQWILKGFAGNLNANHFDFG